jgi:anti-sigma regulatory factor (Ser/Thr protein kinase)
MYQPATAARPPGPARTWEASYPGTADQVRRVRADLRPLLAGCSLADDVIAVVSELTANAVTHSDSRRPGGTFTVRLGYRPGEHVRAEVADQGSTWHGDLARSARDQHGLHIVLALATASGTSRDEAGTTVWFRIDHPARPTPGPAPPGAGDRSLPRRASAGKARLPVTAAAPDGRPYRDDLAACVFRALYAGFDLHTVHGTHIVVPAGTPWFAGPRLGEIARQISEAEHRRQSAADPHRPGPGAIP